MNEQLLLQNQLCFPLYAASRLVIRAYQPFLDELGITYPQYLVMMVLWEKNELTVNDIVEKLMLQTNTVTPMLQRMEKMGIIERRKAGKDKREVIITLTNKGKSMEVQANDIPQKLVATLHRQSSEAVDVQKLEEMKEWLYTLIHANKDL